MNEFEMPVGNDVPEIEDHNNFAQYLIDNCNIIRLNGMLHTDENEIYTVDREAIEAKIHNICEYTGIDIDQKEIDKIIKRIELKTKYKEVQESSYNYIAFDDEVIDVESFEHKPLNSTDYVLTSKLNIPYVEPSTFKNKTAIVNLVDNYFKQITCGNKKLEQFLYMIIISCCCRTNKFPFAFVLTGNHINSNDGRRVFIDIISKMLGNCVSYQSLNELTNVNSSFDLYSKTCNISEEVERPQISDMSNLRKLIKGREIKADKKSSNFKFTSFATLLINVSELLDFGNVLFGLKEYFKIIPFNTKKPISNTMAEKLLSTESIQYIAYRGITAYSQALRNKDFSVPKVVEIATNNYFLDNNSVKQYCTENPIIEIQYKSFYYHQYCKWCIDNNAQRVSRAHFGREVIKFGYKAKRYSFKGKRAQCYVTEDFDINQCRKKYTKFLEENGFNPKDIKDVELVKFIIEYNSENDIEEESNAGNNIYGFGESLPEFFDFKL